MPARAWVIAIETYDRSKGLLHKTLPGTHLAAVAFREWLLTQKGLDPADILFNTDGQSLPGRTGGATSADLEDAFDRVTSWANNTPELYVFFSGHGFFYTDTGGRRTADIIIASDFEKLRGSGRACVQLDEIQTLLRLSMGKGEHFYFIDACRNEISAEEVNPAGLGKVPPRSRLGDPSLFTLYSTRRKGTASATSGFSKHLLSGLAGRGRAKRWKGPAMVVVFESLKDYVRARITGQRVDSQTSGSTEGLIFTIAPPPTYECVIRVEGATAADEFDLSVSDAKQRFVRRETFPGAEYRFSELPDEYYVTVSHSTDIVLPVDEPPADLYDRCTVRFRKTSIPRIGIGAGAGVGIGVDQPPAVHGTLRIIGAENGSIEVTNLRDGETKLSDDILVTETLPSGRYRVVLRDKAGYELKSEEIQLNSGAELTIDLGRRAATPLHEAILKQLPGYAHTERSVEFSEQVGWLPDDDLDVWLAIVGASRIVDDPKEFSKLGHFPLHSFGKSRPGASALYVLAGQEHRSRLSIQVWPEEKMTYAKPVKGIPGLYECVLDVAEGPKLLSISDRTNVLATIVSHCLPNRATLVTLTREAIRGLSVRQYILPIWSVRNYLPPRVQERLPDANSLSSLDSVRFIAMAQRRFALQQEVAPQPESLDNRYWQGLLYDKWLEPIIALITAYELIRRGDFEFLNTVVNNLRDFFGSIPDTEAIAKLCRLEYTTPRTAPIFLEGVLAFEDRSLLARLDFRKPWTCWTSRPISTVLQSMDYSAGHNAA